MVTEIIFHLENYPGTGIILIPSHPSTFTSKLKLHDNSGRKLYLNVTVSVSQGAAIKVSILIKYFRNMFSFRVYQYWCIQIEIFFVNFRWRYIRLIGSWIKLRYRWSFGKKASPRRQLDNLKSTKLLEWSLLLCFRWPMRKLVQRLWRGLVSVFIRRARLRYSLYVPTLFFPTLLGIYFEKYLFSL